MGSGDWFKNMISMKKVKVGRLRQIKKGSVPGKSCGVKSKNCSQKECSNGNCRILAVPVENVAATRIQTAFRAYKARKALRNLKGIARLQRLTQGPCVGKQASMTLNYLHSWNRIQSEIKARRLCMVTNSRIKQKKLDNQLKLEAKLHDLEVEWSGGSETMDEILGRIYQREEAAVKRERAMAYAFSHQWRANAGSYLGPYSSEFSKSYWGWSWVERWIAARPWESRVLLTPSNKSQQATKGSGKSKNITSSPAAIKTPLSVQQLLSPNGKVTTTTKARKLTYPAAAKPVPQDPKADVANLNKTESNGNV